MTVGELIARLKKEDPNRVVILSRDVEGNGFSPLYGIWTGAYLPNLHHPWDVNVGLEELTEEDRDNGYGEDDLLPGGEPALIMTPMN